jgi:L-lactate dehydrogenase (cytochrome)
MGEAGVARALEIIRKELDVTMALCGLRDVRQVNGDILARPQPHLAPL